MDKQILGKGEGQMELKDLRVHTQEANFLKNYFQIIIRAFGGGACFFVTDLDTITFKHAEKFDIPGLEVGTRYSQEGLAAQAIQARKVIERDLAIELYGVRVYAIGGPIWNESDSEIIGAWALMEPRQHKIVQAFDSFAPTLAEVLPEGGFICVTDREKYVKRQGTKKFDMAELQVNTPIRVGSGPEKAIKQKELIIQEVDENIFGFPILTASEPLIDENGDVVGSFTVMLAPQIGKRTQRSRRFIGSGVDWGVRLHAANYRGDKRHQLQSKPLAPGNSNSEEPTGQY